MKERPILFSAPMVRALLEGRKSMTRRVVKGDPYWDTNPMEYSNSPGWWSDREDHDAVKCPYGVPGSRLWVRESWCVGYELEPGRFTAIPFRGCEQRRRAFYRATNHDDPDGPQRAWRSPIHMPRWASRITLEVTDVRVERLQEISEEDARAEGIAEPHPVHGAWCDPKKGREGHWSYRKAFSELWDSLNAKRAPWKSNPLVWKIGLRRVSDASHSAYS